MKWYKCHAPNIHDQALIVDEETGENIAVAYRGSKDGDLIAAAPTMLALLHRLLEDMELEDTEAHELISAAIAKAEGAPYEDHTRQLLPAGMPNEPKCPKCDASLEYGGSMRYAETTYGDAYFEIDEEGNPIVRVKFSDDFGGHDLFCGECNQPISAGDLDIDNER